MNIYLQYANEVFVAAKLSRIPVKRKNSPKRDTVNKEMFNMIKLITNDMRVSSGVQSYIRVMGKQRPKGTAELRGSSGKVKKPEIYPE